MAAESGRGRQPSQADVARAAGVSAQTVSRVVSGHPNVRPETARRVRQAMEDLRYRLNSSASALATARTRVIGVINVATNNYSTGAVALGIEAAAAAEGYTVTTATVPEHATRDDYLAVFDRLERQGAEGIILAAPITFEDDALRLRMERTPTAYSDHSGAPDERMVPNQREMGRLATEHLLSLGHKTVWHISGNPAWPEAQEREKGWENALQEKGIVPPPVFPGDWTPESGYRAGKTLASIPGVTAVFVSSDEMAFGLLKALNESGLSVPEDVSVVGVDDIALAEYAAPPLTTVRQPFAALGRTTATRLIDQIEQREPQSTPPVEAELVIRSSTGAAPS